MKINYDAVIIGGGFYGAAIAIYLAKNRGLKRIALIEREAALLTRASFNNQARVHNGYHYPRSFTTAYRSRINFPRFIKDWPQAVKKDFIKLYAISRRNSKVTAKQFQRFCHGIGAKIQPAEQNLRQLFNPQLIEDVFAVEEYGFDSTKLADWAGEELKVCGVDIYLQTNVTSIFKANNNALSVAATLKDASHELFNCNYVFNCTYSGLNQFKGDFVSTRTNLKHEVTEMALMKMPLPLSGMGVTVMDGPFFSIMPFPARNLHTLSHVRYTPHMHWRDTKDVNPYEMLRQYDCSTRVDRMVRDVVRYLPVVEAANYVESLFEVKTVLIKNEGDGGRPILFEKHLDLPGCYSILGGKIDNIFDILEKLDEELF